MRQGRSWTRKFTDYLSVVLVGPVLVVTALGLLASVQSQTLCIHGACRGHSSSGLL
ncbi:MAG: hypothetical protein AB1451_11880 [Nitrospirota bacterium]